MSCSYFDKNVADQCTLAGQFLKLDCCPAGANPACDQAVDESRIPEVFGSAGLTAQTIPPGDAAYQQALAKAALVLVMLAFPATYHFIVLSAYSASGYVVDDPNYTQSFPATYDQISTAYNEGNIASAWVVSAQ